MNYFIKAFKSLPLAIGIIFALISISFTVNIAGSGDKDSGNAIVSAIIGAIFFGLIGYPLLIASAMSLIKNSEDA